MGRWYLSRTFWVHGHVQHGVEAGGEAEEGGREEEVLDAIAMVICPTYGIGYPRNLRRERHITRRQSLSLPHALTTNRPT